MACSSLSLSTANFSTVGIFFQACKLDFVDFFLSFLKKADAEDLDPEVGNILQTATNHEEVQVETHLSALSEIINVTIPVQCLVEQPSRLILYAGSKLGLAGFFDPCGAGVEKQLLIRYTFQNKMHQVIIRDDEQLRCPRLAHQLAQ